LRICNLVPVWIKCTLSEAPIPVAGVGDTEGARSTPRGGLQFGVTLQWDARKNISLIMNIHKVYLTRVTFILAKDSKSKITKSPF